MCTIRVQNFRKLLYKLSFLKFLGKLSREKNRKTSYTPSNAHILVSSQRSASFRHLAKSGSSRKSNRIWNACRSSYSFMSSFIIVIIVTVKLQLIRILLSTAIRSIVVIMLCTILNRYDAVTFTLHIFHEQGNLMVKTFITHCNIFYYRNEGLRSPFKSKLKT